MPFITAHPNEYLVVGRRGHIINHGVAARTFLWPGTSYVLLSSTQQEASFEMTQESRDGIPLRFKGIVVYRVVQPELTAQLFNFADGNGHAAIQALLSHMCLGELRALVAQMTMSECIEQRKTTLTDVVSATGWGITLDVVQVAQVFIVDQELRRQLEAEVRNQIKGQSDLSELRMHEELKRAQAASERRLQQEGLETEKERMAITRAKLQLQNELEREEIESKTPLRLLQIAMQQDVAQAEVALAHITNTLRTLEVEREMLLAQAQQKLRKEILPLEQIPLIAESAAKVWQGANLSIYGETAPVVATLGPLLEVLTQALRSSEANHIVDQGQN
jgi:flotillin